MTEAESVTRSETATGQYSKPGSYKIAGIDIGVSGAGERYLQQSMQYRSLQYTKNPDIEIDITGDTVKSFNRIHSYFTQDECAYILSSEVFSEKILDHSGFILHASAIVLDGQAYLFSAPSGTGKSTHTSLWIETFGNGRAHILNDDKPAIRRLGKKYYAYGTPWSGKTALNANESVPLQAIAFIERSDYDWIRPMNTSEAVLYLTHNIICPKSVLNYEKLIPLIDGLLRDVSIYHMGCTMSVNAVNLAYCTMKKG